MKRNGRRALIERPDIKNTAHLDLLDAVERTLVSYRWGIATGEPLTQAETAAAMNTTRDTVRRVEAGAAQKIIEHLQSTPRTDPVPVSEIASLRVRVDELSRRLDVLATLDEILADVIVDVTHLTEIVEQPKRRRFRRKS